MTTSDNLSTQVVSSQQQYRDFFTLRRTLYRDDPSVVFPLDSMDRLQLDVEKHPFFEHATREAFVCYDGDRPVGRIVAIHDELHNDHNDDRVGFFGFFESIDRQDVVSALIKTAENWLRNRGCDTIRGPVNPSMKSDFGVLVEGHETSPMIMMGHTPARYEDNLKAEGLEPIKSFVAYQFFSKNTHTTKDQWSHLAAARIKILNRHPKLLLRAVDESNYEQTLREINELGNTVRAEGWGFVPMTENELAFMIKNLRRVIQFDMMQVAYWDGKLVGYIVSIPDVNWALKRTRSRWDWLRMIQMPFLLRRTPRARVIALGVDPSYRAKGVAMLLISQLVEKYTAFDEWEFSWVDEDNLKSIRAIGRMFPLVVSKRYRLFEKPIGPVGQ